MTTTDPTEPTPTPERPPRNVVEALARVLAELGGIPKLTSQQRQKAGMSTGSGEGGLTYAYRSVDQLAAAAQPLLGKYGVVIVPRKVEATVTEITVNNKPWTDERHKVIWRIYGPGGLEDWIKAKSIGVGRDNSDKGANKASTMAYKNLLLRLFSIGDPSDDADHERVETQREPTISVEAQEAIRAVIAAIPTEEERMKVRAQVASTWGRPAEILARDGSDVQTFVLSKLREALATAAPTTATTEPAALPLGEPDPTPAPEPEPEPVHDQERTPPVAPTPRAKAGSRAQAQPS
jgi:hypothetical protein